LGYRAGSSGKQVQNIIKVDSRRHDDVSRVTAIGAGLTIVVGDSAVLLGWSTAVVNVL
jgi:hypothetical protein